VKDSGPELAQQEDRMTDAWPGLRIGDRVRYVDGTVSGTARKGEIGTIAGMSSDRTGVDVMFDDGLERGVTVALLELA